MPTQLDAAEIGFFAAAARPCDTYLAAASALLPGAELSFGRNQPQEATFTLVAGFIAEALLKALLAEVVPAKTLSDSKVRHDLEALWAWASSKTGAVPSVKPAWLIAVNAFHR